jgi:hypothetical protein
LTRDVTFQLDGPLGFGTPEHDVIVPLDSQMGRISATSLFEGTVHSSNLVPASIAVDPSETNSAEIQQQVATLLSSSGGPNFGPCFPAPASVAPLARMAAEPATPRGMVSATGVTPASATEKQIRIVQPVDGTVVSLVSGSSVTVAVEASGGATVQRMLLFIGNLGMVVAPNVLPAQIVVPIPRDAPVGQMKIAAIALDVSGVLLGGVTSVELKAPAPPVKFTVEPQRLTLTPEVPARQLRVTGTFTWDATSHVDRDVTLASQGTIYRAVNGESVVRVSPDGIVTAVRAGSDIIEVRNGGQVVLVEVTSAPAPVDVTPPITTATPSPTANAHGWNNGDVSVALQAADETGGSGVRDIHFTLSDGTTTTSQVVAGANASILVTLEGTKTLDFFATDNAGNVEATHHLTIRIDKTAPVVTGTRLTPPNANGWNNGSVQVRFRAADALSGIDGAATIDRTVSGEGANQSVSQTFFDLAGNPGSATVTAISIDRTAPVTTAVENVPANQNGWHNTSVFVTLLPTDNLSGLASTEFNLDGGSFTPYTAPIAITAEGIHTLQYRSTDRADNQEALRTLIVRIDLTPPEAVLSFDPLTRDLAVSGRDTLSAVRAPISATVSATPRREELNAELRSYRVEDLAGNSLEIAVSIKREGHELKASIRSLRYNGGAPITPPENKLAFEWSFTSTGGLKELEQHVEVGGRDEQEAEAKFRARRDATTIKLANRGGERAIVRPGLVLLRLVTDGGKLVIELD